MKKFETLKDYETVAELNDILAVGSYEINPSYRMETFTVVDIFRGKVTIQSWGQNRQRIILEDEQEIKLISQEHFKTLKR